MAPQVRSHPGTRPTELGGSLWTPQSLAHPTRTHRPRITTTPLRLTTLAWSVPARVLRAGYSSATKTSTARRGKLPTGAVVAQIADSPWSDNLRPHPTTPQAVLVRPDGG